VKPAPFAYRRCHSIEEAVSLLGELGEDAKVLAGGQSLVPMMNFRLARPSALVDLNSISGLDYLRVDETGLSIGALTRHRAVEICEAPALQQYFAVLSKTMHLVGHHPVRTRGTVGGSLAHADPTAEWCLLALLLEAEIRVTGPEGTRAIAAQDFFRGFLSTALGPTEVVHEIWFPIANRKSALVEFAQRHGDFAIVAAAAALEVDNGTCTSARIVLGGVDVVPRQAPEAEAVLVGSELEPAVISETCAVAAASFEPTSDIHGSSEYRKHLIGVLVERAIAEVR
jgi:aerobic carbon-monoxide dehydrogenase medium subunit